MKIARNLRRKGMGMTPHSGKNAKRRWRRTFRATARMKQFCVVPKLRLENASREALEVRIPAEGDSRNRLRNKHSPCRKAGLAFPSESTGEFFPGTCSPEGRHERRSERL